MHPEAGAVVELLRALLALEAPLFGVERVGVDVEVGLEGEAPRAEAALVTLPNPNRLLVLLVLGALQPLRNLTEQCNCLMKVSRYYNQNQVNVAIFPKESYFIC